MSNTLRIQNTSEREQQFFANANKSIKEGLKKNNIVFAEAGRDFISIQIPPQAIIEVLDGEQTQSELHIAVKGKVVKDVTKDTQYIQSTNTNKDLETENANLKAEIEKLKQSTKTQ